MRIADKFRKCHKEEAGVYSLTENMIVLPVVFLVVYALLFAGFILHAQCTIESAAKRGVLYASKLICDPQYETVTVNAVDPQRGELNELSSKDFNFTRNPEASIQPYRYVPLLNGMGDNNYFKRIESKVQNYVRNIIDQNVTWMFTIDDENIKCDISSLVITQTAVVEITAKYEVPVILQWLGVPETYDLKARAVLTVSDQDEFIRNVDFVQSLLVRVLDATGISDKAQGVVKAISDPMQKMVMFVKKLFQFK